MQLELSGQEVFIGFGIIAMILVVLISILRRFFKSNRVKHSSESGFQLSERVKYASVDVFRHSRRLFGLALSLSLLVVICGFSWTTYDRTYADLGPLYIEEPIDQVEPPIIPPPAPKPPVLPPPVIEEVPEIDMNEEPADLPDAFIEKTDPIVEPCDATASASVPHRSSLVSKTEGVGRRRAWCYCSRAAVLLAWGRPCPMAVSGPSWFATPDRIVCGSS